MSDIHSMNIEEEKEAKEEKEENVEEFTDMNIDTDDEMPDLFDDADVETVVIQEDYSGNNENVNYFDNAEENNLQKKIKVIELINPEDSRASDVMSIFEAISIINADAAAIAAGCRTNIPAEWDNYTPVVIAKLKLLKGMGNKSIRRKDNEDNYHKWDRKDFRYLPSSFFDEVKDLL